MKVFVLGDHGMLGHVVARYLAEQGMEVMSSRERYLGGASDRLIAAVRNSGAEWVVNAIGKFGAKDSDTSEMMLMNAMLPVHIKSYLHAGQRLIHASTDGVFSGNTGNYAVDAERDAQDAYGFSKILGEVIAEEEKAYIIRTSIIGPQGSRDSGLLGWFLKQTGDVKGFTNHFWNGITTLEWAKVCGQIIAGEFKNTQPIVQPGSPERISKYDLLKTISEVWNHRVSIQACKAPVDMDRTLFPQVSRPSIQKQIEELRAWY